MTTQKIKEIQSALLAEYDRLQVKRKPTLQWRIDAALKHEEFHTLYAGGVLRIEAGSAFACIFALQQMQSALLSGHFGEFLGKFIPRFSLRPIKLPPGDFKEELCSRLVLLGYNAVIVEGGEISIFHEHGLKVFVSGNDLSKLDSVDGIFWESSLLTPEFFQHPKAKEMTTAELVQEEVKRIEAQIGSRQLIYYIPSSDENGAKQQALWIENLCDEVGNHTVIAFSSVCGNPAYDHLNPHPLWDVLRRAPDVSSTPLMPVFNIGAICQGEGLWPSSSFDLLQERFERHHFAGIIALGNAIPLQKGFLHLNLWVASMWMWHGGDPRCLAETWFLAYRPDLNFASHAFLLEKVRTIVKELSYLKFEQPSQEELHAMGDSLGGQLKQLKMEFEKKKQQGEGASFLDYFTCFEKDVRNILDKVSHSQKFGGGGASFWADRQGVFDRPHQGKPGSLMEKVFDENN